jgi:hypothetical protein
MKLTMEEVQKLKADIEECEDIGKCRAFGNGDMICSMANRCKRRMNLIDTIEAQQQEIEQFLQAFELTKEVLAIIRKKENDSTCNHRKGIWR